MPTWDGKYSQIAEWWRVASDNFVSHNRPKAGVGRVQLAVFSKKASERQRLAKRAMRSFHNPFFDRITDGHAGRGSHGATESAGNWNNDGLSS